MFSVCFLLEWEVKDSGPIPPQEVMSSVFCTFLISISAALFDLISAHFQLYSSI